VSLLEDDERKRPDLFLWNGPIPREGLEQRLAFLRITAPDDLVAFWLRTGGGDIFETETLLAPMGPPLHEVLDVASATADGKKKGLPEGCPVFHVGLGMSFVDRDGRFVHRGPKGQIGVYSSLQEWYRVAIHAQYQDRYGLGK
jgi:hypothetical protein